MNTTSTRSGASFMRSGASLMRAGASLIAILALIAGSALASCDGDLPSDTTTAGTNTSTMGTGAQGGEAGSAGAGGAAGSAGAAGAGGAPDCYMFPKTHVEIINACTDAEKVEKHPVLPLLNGDGSLPPLP